MIRPSGRPIVPVYEGYFQNDDGSYTISFGYASMNLEEALHIPLGPDNFIEPAEFDGPQPTYFKEIHPRIRPAVEQLPDQGSRGLRRSTHCLDVEEPRADVFYPRPYHGTVLSHRDPIGAGEVPARDLQRLCADAPFRPGRSLGTRPVGHSVRSAHRESGRAIGDPRLCEFRRNTVRGAGELAVPGCTIQGLAMWFSAKTRSKSH